MFEHATVRKIRDMKFSAVLHGADPKELDGKDFESVNHKKDLLFGDPSDYEKMSEEDRKELSDQMMTKFTKWSKEK